MIWKAIGTAFLAMVVLGVLLGIIAANVWVVDLDELKKNEDEDGGEQ